MRIVIQTLLVIVTGCSARPSAGPATSEISGGETVTVIMSNFSFDPDHVQLRVGQPVRLRLVNESNGGHNFSSPTFFAASTVAPGSATSADGGIEVAAHQTVEIALIPRQPGTYQLRCTHTLHDLFGMTGAIEVTS
jgi:plastocyanin